MVIFGGPDFKISDITRSDRQFQSRLFEVVNKKMDYKKGDVTVDLIDSNFDKDSRFCLISPSTKVSSSISSTQVAIKPSFSEVTESDEGLKWEKYVGASLIVRTPDYVTTSKSILKSVSPNLLEFETALTFTPSTDDIIELSPYSDQPTEVTLVFGFMSDTAFPDGTVQYQMV